MVSPRFSTRENQGGIVILLVPTYRYYMQEWGDDMIYITGDTHGNFRRFSTDIFPEQKQMTKDDYVIICGDFGIWNDSPEERHWLDWLNEKNFTTLFLVCGWQP